MEIELNRLFLKELKEEHRHKTKQLNTAIFATELVGCFVGKEQVKSHIQLIKEFKKTHLKNKP